MKLLIEDNMTVVLTTSLSLLSALIVAVSAHFFSAKRKRADELAQMRLSAYTDFINAVSRLVSARRLGVKTNEVEELAILNDAKTRICICADASVVQALTKFWSYGSTLEKEEEILAFTKLCLRIRESLGNKRNDISDLNISNTLFKLEPSTYSFRVDK